MKNEEKKAKFQSGLQTIRLEPILGARSARKVLTQQTRLKFTIKSK